MSSIDRSCSHRSELLGQVAVALNPDALIQKVQGPIELAMGTFETPQACVSNRDEFLDVAASFVRHLYWQGSGTPVRMSTMQARARALQLLEKQYEGVFASGYVGAYLDATRPEGPGLRAVLATLAGLVAKEQVQQRTTSVLVRLISPTDWTTQHRLVEQLMFSLGPSLPRHLAERPTESLVPAYRELVAVFLQSEDFLAASNHITKTLRALRSLGK